MFGKGVNTVRELSSVLLGWYIQMIAAEDLFVPELKKHSRLLEYEKGELIVAADERLLSMMILVSGTAQVCSYSPDGKLVVVAHAEPPQMIGDIEYLQDKKTLHHVYAKSRVRVIAISADVLPMYCTDSLAFYRLICRNLINKLYDTSYEYSRSLLYPAKNRLAKYLADHVDGDGMVYLKIKDTAEKLGITTRHLSRLINDFERLGIIKRVGAKVFDIIQEDKLQALINR